MQRINIWSSPRNVSTALMYSFAQRSDTTVVDEPLYAHYLAHAGPEAEHPGREEILQSQSQDSGQVLQKVLLGDYPTPVVVFKQMTHHLAGLDWGFLQQMDNILLIRDPDAIIRSYARVIPEPSLRDIGVGLQLDLFNYLQGINRLSAVIEARELLREPRSILTQLCERLSLPFQESMLHWKAGPRPEDGVWARYWYATVHRSTGFLPYEDRPVELPEHLLPLAREARPYYDALRDYTLKAPSSSG